MAQLDSATARRQGPTTAKFGELLVKSGKITQAQLQEALALQKEQGGRLGSNLVKLGFLTDRQLVESLSQHFRVSSVDLFCESSLCLLSWKSLSAPSRRANFPFFTFLKSSLRPSAMKTWL